MGPHSSVFQVAGVVRWRQHITAAIAALSLAWMVSWGRLEPITVIASSVTQSVHPGDFIEARREVKFHRWDCWSYSASTSLTDSLRYKHQIESRDFGLPNRNSVSNREWQIPFTMPFGQAKIETDLSFSCMPFFKAWPIVVELPELTFNVIPR